MLYNDIYEVLKKRRNSRKIRKQQKIGYSLENLLIYANV